MNKLLLPLLFLMCENVNAAPEVSYVVLVSSSRCSCVAIGGSALQSAENRLSAIRPAWSLHRPSDRLPQGVMGEFLSVRAVCEARMGWRLGEQFVQVGRGGAGFQSDLRGRGDYSVNLGTAASGDNQLRRSSARKACDPSRQSDLRLLLSKSGVRSRWIHEGRLMGVANVAEQNADRNTAAAAEPFTLSSPMCQTGFTVAQRYDERNAAGAIIKSVWVRKCVRVPRIVYGKRS